MASALQERLVEQALTLIVRADVAPDDLADRARQALGRGRSMGSRCAGHERTRTRTSRGAWFRHAGVACFYANKNHYYYMTARGPEFLRGVALKDVRACRTETAAPADSATDRVFCLVSVSGTRRPAVAGGARLGARTHRWAPCFSLPAVQGAGRPTATRIARAVAQCALRFAPARTPGSRRAGADAARPRARAPDRARAALREAP